METESFLINKKFKAPFFRLKNVDEQYYSIDDLLGKPMDSKTVHQITTIAKEVEAAVAQSIGEAMSAGVVSAIAQATGEAIDAAIESELAAAIDAEIAYAVSLGIEEAAVAAGWQAYFDVLTSGGTDAQASTAAYEACGSSCDGY